MKISQVLHYYIGQKVLHKPYRDDPKQLMGRLVYIGENKHATIATTPLIDEPEWHITYRPEDCLLQLALRRLEDIGDAEWLEIEAETSIAPDAFGYYGIRDNFMKRTAQYRFDWSLVNQALIALRQRGVDVDGLIESGQAVDVKMIK